MPSRARDDVALMQQIGVLLPMGDAACRRHRARDVNRVPSLSVCQTFQTGDTAQQVQDHLRREEQLLVSEQQSHDPALSRAHAQQRTGAQLAARLTVSHVARRVFIAGVVDVGAMVATARELGLMGWVRPTGEMHVEGEPGAVEALLSSLGTDVRVEPARVEGHEQFAVRGVSAGVFVVQEHRATAHHYDLRLEVQGVMRSWAVPKGPSLDPAAKRLAVQVEDHDPSHNDFEGPLGSGGVIVWDRGTYEQGGRVRWPDALTRGHAVFVLNGEKLRGGFALQRTRQGSGPQWLLIKRRDDSARPGSDIVAERPESVVSGRTLAEITTD